MANHRTENFFAPATVGLVHVEQNRRLKIKTLRARTIAAARKPAFPLAGILQELLDRLTLPRRDEGTDLRFRLGRIAHG